MNNLVRGLSKFGGTVLFYDAAIRPIYWCLFCLYLIVFLLTEIKTVTTLSEILS